MTRRANAWSHTNHDARQLVAQSPRVELEEGARELAATLEVGLHRGVAVEAEHGDVLEVAAQHLAQVVGLEEVHVVRVLEVGGRVRRDEERGPVVVEHPGRLGDVPLGLVEVLDQVRRAHPVDAARAHCDL